MIIKQDIIENYIKNYLIANNNYNRLKYLKRQQAKENFEPEFYISNISRCPREVVYDMLQYPRSSKDPKFFLIGENGNYMHRRYQRWLANSGILLFSEYPLKIPKYRISAKVDAIISLCGLVPEMDDELAVVELKSSNNKKFSKMTEKNQPLIEYIEQIMLYLHFLEIPYGIIYVENKDNQDILEFWIEYDNKLAQELVQRIEMINDYVDKKELPPRPYSSPKCYTCLWCDFKDACWGSN